MQRRITFLLLLCITAIPLSTVFAAQPSFDCSKARSWSENAVCNDVTLAALDVQVAALYSSARAHITGKERKRIKNDQRAWLRQRESCKDNANTSACLVQVYNKRISQLGSVAHSGLASASTGDIKEVDFSNFTYDLGETLCAEILGKSSVQLRNGKFGDIHNSFGIATDRITYGDITGDGKDEAVIIAYCGGMHPVEQAFVYSVIDGRTMLLTNLEPGSRANGGIVRSHLCRGCGNGIVIQDGLITVERMYGEAACCPEYVGGTTYRWSRNGLIQVATGQRKEFVERLPTPEIAKADSNPNIVATVSPDMKATDTLTVDGRTVSYHPAGQGTIFADFEFNSKGYRNTYSLDCEKKRFLWTKNVQLSTGRAMGNNTAAEWKPLNPNSTISNAVFEAICPQLLASAGERSFDAGTAVHPPASFIDKGACPSEGCTYGLWRFTKPISVRSSPDDKSPVIGSIKAGEAVQALTGEVHVTPSRFLVSKSHGKYTKGDVLWVYTYSGEGFFKVWFRGETYKEDLGFSPYGSSSGTRCEASAWCWGELEKELQSTWWVQVKTSDGLTGWTADTHHFVQSDIGEKTVHREVALTPNAEMHTLEDKDGGQLFPAVGATKSADTYTEKREVKDDSTKIGTSGGHDKSESFGYNLHTSMITNIEERPTIEKSTAATLIQEHAANSYTSVDIGKSFIKDESMNRTTAEDILDKLGLITVKYKAKKDLSKRMGISEMMKFGISGNHSSITTKLTRKGERVGIPIQKRESKSRPEIGFPKGKLIVDRIVSISQDNVVLFAITHKSNELGKLLGVKGEKLRGKATFKYDPFLEKFIFTGFWLSEWEEQKWEDYYWLKKTQGKTLLIHGLDMTL